MPQADTFQIEPPEQKSSGGGKLLLGIGIGCGIVGLLCCGGFAGLGWWTADFFRNAVSTDPAKIATERDRIASVAIPDRLEPQMMFRFDPPFVDEIGTMVLYANEAEEEMLLLGDYRGVPTGGDPSDVLRELDPNARFQVDDQQRRIDLAPDQDPAFEETSREAVERPVRGGTARFEIIQGTNTETDQERIVVYGTFPGRLGGGIFMMSVSADKSSLEEVKQVIESLE